MRKKLLATVLVIAGVASDARAQEPDEAEPGALPVLAAIVPGFAASGVGTWVAGDKRTAKRIFHVQLLGLGVASAGALPMFLTGASRRTTAFTMPLVLAGSGVFLGSWMADIMAAATGGLSSRPLAPPPVELRFGYAYVHDPQFDYQSFAVLGGHWHRAPWRAGGEAWIAADDDAQRLRAEGARRVWQQPDETYVEVQAAATFDRLGDFDTEVYTLEASVLGRYDMARLGRPLRGSFMEIGLGLGLEHYRFADGALTLDLPLARAGYGVYLGRGEAQVYYDHRHDEITGGLGTGLQFDGPYGHIGVQGRYWFAGALGVDAQLEVGAAAVARVSVVWAL